MSELPADAVVRPWFRQLWPWLLMLPPVLAVAGGVVMIWLAVNTPGVLIVEDYARIEELTADRFERDREAARLGLSAELSFTNENRDVDLTLRAAADYQKPARLILLLQHVTDPDRDIEIRLPRFGDRYSAQAELEPGRYHIEAMDAARSWRLGISAYLPARGIEMNPQTDRM